MAATAIEGYKPLNSFQAENTTPFSKVAEEDWDFEHFAFDLEGLLSPFWMSLLFIGDFLQIHGVVSVCMELPNSNASRKLLLIWPPTQCNVCAQSSSMRRPLERCNTIACCSESGFFPRIHHPWALLSLARRFFCADCRVWKHLKVVTW